MDFEQKFDKPVIKIGRWTMFLALIATFIPSLYLLVVYGEMPKIQHIIAGYILIASTQAPYYFIEPISYFPVLGLSGTYMSFLAGSISGVRLPTVSVVQDLMGITPGTQKAELVNTLAIAGSVVVTTIAGLIAVTVGGTLIGILPESVVGAFNYVLPAIFGSTFGSFAVKDPKIAIVALVLAVFVNKTGILPGYFAIPAVIVATVAIAIFAQKKQEA